MLCFFRRLGRSEQPTRIDLELLELRRRQLNVAIGLRLLESESCADGKLSA